MIKYIRNGKESMKMGREQRRKMCKFFVFELLLTVLLCAACIHVMMGLDVNEITAELGTVVKET
jgi:uncharacterized membrane protein YbhN (UPF0104 family)